MIAVPSFLPLAGLYAAPCGAFPVGNGRGFFYMAQHVQGWRAKLQTLLGRFDSVLGRHLDKRSYFFVFRHARIFLTLSGPETT